MKKIFSNRLELVFSLSLAAILGLPPLVLAQDTKSIEIHINNGDTTVNGKNIKKMTPDERKDALGEINKMGNLTFEHSDKDGNRDIVIRRNTIVRRGDKNAPPPPPTPHMFGNGDNASSPYTMDFYTRSDRDTSGRRPFRLKLRRIPGGDSVMAFNFRDGDEPGPDRMQFRMDRRAQGFNGNGPMHLRLRPMDGPRGERFGGPEGRNTQVFNYATTDNDGISTEVSFRVSDARAEVIKRIAGAEKAALDISDLNLSPEFSTGKTMVSFNLPAKTAATVKLTDSEGKLLWSDKATAGSFVKKVSLPRNGIYFLVVKQGNNTGVKRIVKE